MKFIKRLWSYLRPYKKLFIFLVFLNVIFNFLNLSLPYITKLIIDKGIVGKNLRFLNIISIITVLIYLSRSRIQSLAIITSNKLQQGFIFRLRNHVYYKLQKLSLSYFEKERRGPIVSKVITDVNACQRVVVEGLSMIINSIISFIGGIIILSYLNWKLMLLTLIPLPFVAYLIHDVTKKIHRGYRKTRQKMAEVMSVLQENVFGIREIKSFTQENYEMSRFSQKGRRFYKVNVFVARLWANYFPLIMFFTSLGTILVLWYGGRQVINGNLTLGTVVAFTGYLNLLYAPIQQLNMLNNMFQQTKAAAERIFKIIDTPPEVKDKPWAVSFPHPLKGDIVFKNVSFSYGDDKEILHNVSFEVKKGEILAVVGPSGAGKTTLISLIPRFYDITSGEIIIDGRDIRDYKLFYLRSQIGMVLQEPFLFTGTIAENIGFGKMEATREEIEEVAKAAHAHEFIIQLPDGYDTEIGEMGEKLSVGQKQRIAIARALLKNPPILILDEATSSVDSETEKLIQDALEKLMAGRTSIVIAHRLSTIRNATRIIVLKDGKIVEEGDHKQLLKKGGVYLHLYRLQFGFKEIEEDVPYLMENKGKKNV